MTTKKFNQFENLFGSIFEFMYAEGCEFEWPFTNQDDVDRYSVIRSGFIYEDLHTFLKQNNIFAEKVSDNTFDVEDDYYDEEKNQERERLLAAKIETWPFDKVVCSCIFYTVNQEIKARGNINHLTWEDMVPHLTSDVIGPELLAVIKRNSFFELNPKEAIQGTLGFFYRKCRNYNLLYEPNGQSSILRILESIKVDSKVAQELATQTLKHKDVRFIITFLENYTFFKARRISQQELNSYLKNNISAKKTYLALAKLERVIDGSIGKNLVIITYPPIFLVEKYLQTPPSELNYSIAELLFPSETINTDSKTDSIIFSVMKNILLTFFIVVLLFASKVGVAKAIPKRSAITHYNSTPVAFPNNYPQPIKPVDNTAKNEERIEKRREKKSQITIPPIRKTILPVSVTWKTTKLDFFSNDKGYVLTGNYGPYANLKTAQWQIKNDPKYGPPLAIEEIDHILVDVYRKSLMLPTNHGNKSSAIIVPVGVNQKRTDRKSGAFIRPLSVSYQDKPDFLDYMKLLVTNSVTNLELNQFTQKQAINWAFFEEFIDLPQLKKAYTQPIERLIQEIQDGFLTRNIIHPNEGLLASDVLLLHHRWNLNNDKGNVVSLTSFSDLETFIENKLRIIRQQLVLSRSALLHLDPDSPITAYLSNKQTILAMCSIAECRHTLRIYASLNKPSKNSLLEQKIDQLSKEISQPESDYLFNLEELDNEMRKFGCTDMYKKNR